MSEIQRIVDLIRSLYIGPHAWHGPALATVLEGIDSDMAVARPVAGAHSILEVVRHIIVWQDAAVHWLNGDSSHTVTDELDWQSEVGENAWQDTLRQLEEHTAIFIDTVRELSDDDLPEKRAGKRYTNYDMIHGVLQHTMYHTGQIALLRRAMAGANS